MKSGTLIAFEGLDGSGKATQAMLLKRRLQKAGKTVTLFSFPQYGTLVGKFIRDTLYGMHGDLHAIPPYHGTIPYSLDRGIAAPKIRTALARGIVIADRYTTASLAYAGAIAGPKEASRLTRFIEQLEYRELKVPRPDAVVYLVADAKTARSRMRREPAKKLDRNERDIAFQKRVAAHYAKLAKRKEWLTIACSADETPREIHERVWQALQKKVR